MFASRSALGIALILGACAFASGELCSPTSKGICEVPPDQLGVEPDSNCVNGVSDWKNLFGYKNYKGDSYDGQCAFFAGKPALAEGLGWFIVVGLGGVFSLGVSFCLWLGEKAVPQRHQAELHTSEHFNSAGRTISAGLTAADIVSKWTWAATLLQSSNVAYQYGVSGPFWYAAGATIQVLLFAVLAVEIKRKCPSIHTVLEIILARWGVTAHLVFMFFCFSTNIIVTAMLILGGAAVVNALTGVNIYAASFLIPVSVIFYTAHGGLFATYMASWGHVAVIYIALLIFVWKVYAGPSDLGSTNKVWENLQSVSQKYPVEWNYKGNFLTMWSTHGIVFGIINVIGNFGTVFVDQSYWQGAIAARPSATYKGYLLGGFAWFAIPFSMATTLGLAGRALDLPITINESGQGLVPPAVAVHLLGPGGAFLITLQLFMAVTATGSAEQIAVSSICAYDIYKRYFKPNASGKEIILVSRITIAMWGVVSGVLSIILLELNISLGWVYECMGNFIGSAVVPIVFSITWRQCSAAGAIAGCISGLLMAITGWLAVAASRSPDGKTLSVETLGDDLAFLCGNVLALFVSPIVCVIVSLIKPQNYDWDHLCKTTESYLIEEDRHAHVQEGNIEDGEEAMNVALKWTWITAGSMTVILIFAWPLLALPQRTFSKSYFGWWVAIAFLWGHFAAFVTVLLPIWEERAFLMHAFGIKKQDFSVTVKDRKGYDPDGSVAYRGEVPGAAALKNAPAPVEMSLKAAGDTPAAPQNVTQYSFPNSYSPTMMPPGAMFPSGYPMPPPGMFPPGAPGMGMPPMGMPGMLPMGGGMPVYGMGYRFGTAGDEIEVRGDR